VPVTFFGRVLATVLMVFGIGIFAVLTSFVATRIIDLRADNQNNDYADLETNIAIVREENAGIRTELAELKELLKQKSVIEDIESKGEVDA
jgi:regulator of replication initiation timing